MLRWKKLQRDLYIFYFVIMRVAPAREIERSTEVEFNVIYRSKWILTNLKCVLELAFPDLHVLDPLLTN